MATGGAEGLAGTRLPTFVLGQMHPMSENNSEKAPKGNRSKPGLAASVTTWRALSHKWCEGYRANTEVWEDEEWDRWEDLYHDLGLATQDLAALLATNGVDIGPLNELARMCRENADEWLADDDRGDGKRLRAIAAIEKLLQDLEPSTEPHPWPSPLATLDALDRPRREMSHGSSVRPARVSREIVTSLLARVFNGLLPADLMGPWLNYLVAKGIVRERDGSFELADGPGQLAAFPRDAQRALHRAIVAHAGTPACPKLLKGVIPAIPVGGSGSLSQGSGPSQASAGSPAASRPNADPEVIERLKWDRPAHVESLSAFGEDAGRMFDAIVASKASGLASISSSRGSAPPPAGEAAQATDPAASGATVIADRANARPRNSDQAAPAAAKGSDDIEFNPIERAIVLLLRDGRSPRSMRDYARDVGVNHSTLSRNERWQSAWAVTQASGSDLPEGSKDAEGTVEATKPEFCENCRQEPIECSVVANGEAVRVCEECAKKLASRTNPRTS